MSTKDIAYSIFCQLSEEQLKGFIALFRDMYPNTVDESNKREEAFENLQSLRRSIPDLDEKRELENYRAERYGV